ncbi:MAG: hypothetical protein KDB00_27630, partial [Planctomycetales bacterium]|nr:hypothetical protein [Planctomycetales bacterium]
MFHWRRSGQNLSFTSRLKKKRARKSKLEALEARQLLAREVSGTLTGDDNWSGTIHVTGDVTVPAGSTLTIEPDTNIKFEAGRWLTGAGSIQALGTSSQPIVFTSALDDSVGEDLTDGFDGVPYAGHWESIYLNGPDSALQNVQIRYAGDRDGSGSGGGSVGSIELSFTSATPSEQTRLSDVLIRDGYSNGLNVFAGAPTLQNVAVNNTNGVPYYFDIDTNPSATGLTASGNVRGDRIDVQGGTLATNRTWDYGDLPLHLIGGDLFIRNDVNTNPVTLSVAPGTVVKVSQGFQIRAMEGALQAIGTSSEPVVFTAAIDDSVGGDSNGDADATSAYPGYWESLYIDGPNSILENVEVRFAGDINGDGAGGGQVGSIELAYPLTDIASQTRLTNVRVKDGYSNGVNVRDESPLLQNVHVENSFGVPFYFDIDTSPTASGLTGQGNLAGDRIAIQGGTLNQDRTWDYGDLPLSLIGGDLYVRTDTGSNPVTLTIAPGTVVKMDRASFINSIEGAIHALGTAAEPIVFTALTDDSIGGDSGGDGNVTTPYPGYWESIYLDGPNNVLENVEIRYAGDTDGNGTGGGQTGSIEIRYAGTDVAAQARLTNVRISDGYSNGVNVRTQSPVLQTVHVEDSLGVPFYFDIDSNPSASGLTGRDNVAGDRIAIQAGTLTEDRTWNYGELPLDLVGGDLFIRQNAQLVPATLTIAAGTVVKMDRATYIQSIEGSIHALGTAAEPIVFTAITDDSIGGDSLGDGDSTSAYPGYWESLYLDGPNNILENVEVRYAGDTDGNGTGGGQVGSIEVRYSGTDADSQARLTNVRVSDGYSNGVNVRTQVPTLENIHVEDAFGVPFFFALASDPSTSGLTARGNLGGDKIVLEAGTISVDRTWDYGDLPLQLTSDLFVRSNAQGPATLTIAPGTVVKMPRASYLQSIEGAIHAIGLADDPIIFTADTDDTVGGDSNGDANATAPYPGYWESIYLDGPGNVLENVEVRYAGDTDGNGIGGGQTPSIHIGFAGTQVDDQARLASVAVSHGYSTGVQVTAGTPTLTNISADENLGVPFYFLLASDPIVSGLTGHGNVAGDQILLQTGTLPSDRTWDFGELPLVLTSDLVIRADGDGPNQLTIAPGTVIKFQAGHYLQTIEGSVSAVGTVEAPIIFTALADDTAGGDSNGDGNASVPYPGYWESLYIAGPGSTFSNVTIRYAGDTNGDGVGGGDVFSLDVDNDLTLTNVNIESSYGGGLMIGSGATVTYNGGRLDSTTESAAARSAIAVSNGALVATDLDILASDGAGDIGIDIANGQSVSVSNSSF